MIQEQWKDWRQNI